MRSPSTKNAVADPGDEILRPGTSYGLVTGYGSSSDGTVYAWDRANRRVIATDKATGAFVAQYRLSEEPERWDAMTGMYVLDRGEAKPPLLYWTDGTRLWATALDAGSGAGGGAAGTASPAASSAPSEAPAKSITSP